MYDNNKTIIHELTNNIYEKYMANKNIDVFVFINKLFV